MPPYVTPDIQKVRDDPEPDESIALAVAVSEGTEIRDVERRVERLEGELTRALPAKVAVIELPQTSLDELCDLDVLDSVSRPDRMEVQT